MAKRERLAFDLQIKAMDDEQPGKFSGYGSVFGNVDSHNDIVERGAFKRSLKGRNPAMLWQHRSDMPIGKFTKVSEDANGLYVEGEINLDVQLGKEAYSLLKQGALSGLSIGYTTRDYEVDRKRGARLLKDVELYEISLVTFPSNEAAQIIGVKDGDAMKEREFEAFLRDEGGFTREAAKAIVSKGYKHFLNLRDAEAKGEDDEVAKELMRLRDIFKNTK
jgi:uncharacterized protein